MCRWGAAGEIRIPAGVSCPPSRYLPAAMSSSPRRSAVAILVAGIVIVGCGGDSDSATGSECLSSLPTAGGGVLSFVDYDMARQTGALDDGDELAALSARTGTMYLDLLERDVFLPDVISRPLATVQDGPIGIADVRCSIAGASSGVEVLILTSDAEVVADDADSFQFATLQDGDRLATGRKDADLTASLDPPAEDDDGAGRRLVEALHSRSAHQGVVTFDRDDSSVASAVGRAMVDGTPRLVVAWTTTETSAEQDETALRESLEESGAADDLAIDDADVSIGDDVVIASIPITSSKAVMYRIVQRYDILLARPPLD